AEAVQHALTNLHYKDAAACFSAYNGDLHVHDFVEIGSHYNLGLPPNYVATYWYDMGATPVILYNPLTSVVGSAIAGYYTTGAGNVWVYNWPASFTATTRGFVGGEPCSSIALPAGAMVTHFLQRS